MTTLEARRFCRAISSRSFRVFVDSVGVGGEDTDPQREGGQTTHRTTLSTKPKETFEGIRLLTT